MPDYSYRVDIAANQNIDITWTTTVSATGQVSNDLTSQSERVVMRNFHTSKYLNVYMPNSTQDEWVPEYSRYYWNLDTRNYYNHWTKTYYYFTRDFDTNEIFATKVVMGGDTKEGTANYNTDIVLVEKTPVMGQKPNNYGIFTYSSDNNAVMPVNLEPGSEINVVPAWDIKEYLGNYAIDDQWGSFPVVKNLVENLDWWDLPGISPVFQWYVKRPNSTDFVVMPLETSRTYKIKGPEKMIDGGTPGNPAENNYGDIGSTFICMVGNVFKKLSSDYRFRSNEFLAMNEDQQPGEAELVYNNINAYTEIDQIKLTENEKMNVPQNASKEQKETILEINEDRQEALSDQTTFLKAHQRNNIIGITIPMPNNINFTPRPTSKVSNDNIILENRNKNLFTFKYDNLEPGSKIEVVPAWDIYKNPIKDFDGSYVNVNDINWNVTENKVDKEMPWYYQDENEIFPQFQWYVKRPNSTHFEKMPLEIFRHYVIKGPEKIIGGEKLGNKSLYNNGDIGSTFMCLIRNSAILADMNDDNDLFNSDEPEQAVINNFELVHNAMQTESTPYKALTFLNKNKEEAYGITIPISQKYNLADLANNDLVTFRPTPPISNDPSNLIASKYSRYTFEHKMFSYKYDNLEPGSKIEVAPAWDIYSGLPDPNFTNGDDGWARYKRAEDETGDWWRLKGINPEFQWWVKRPNSTYFELMAGEINRYYIIKGPEKMIDGGTEANPAIHNYGDIGSSFICFIRNSDGDETYDENDSLVMNNKMPEDLVFMDVPLTIELTKQVRDGISKKAIDILLKSASASQLELANILSYWEHEVFFYSIQSSLHKAAPITIPIPENYDVNNINSRPTSLNPSPSLTIDYINNRPEFLENFIYKYDSLEPGSRIEVVPAWDIFNWRSATDTSLNNKWLVYFNDKIIPGVIYDWWELPGIEPEFQWYVKTSNSTEFKKVSGGTDGSYTIKGNEETIDGVTSANPSLGNNGDMGSTLMCMIRNSYYDNNDDEDEDIDDNLFSKNYDEPDTFVISNLEHYREVKNIALTKSSSLILNELQNNASASVADAQEQILSGLKDYEDNYEETLYHELMDAGNKVIGVTIPLSANHPLKPAPVSDTQNDDIGNTGGDGNTVEEQPGIKLTNEKYMLIWSDPDPEEEVSIVNENKIIIADIEYNYDNNSKKYTYSIDNKIYDFYFYNINESTKEGDVTYIATIDGNKQKTQLKYKEKTEPDADPEEQQPGIKLTDGKIYILKWPDPDPEEEVSLIQENKITIADIEYDYDNNSKKYTYSIGNKIYDFYFYNIDESTKEGEVTYIATIEGNKEKTQLKYTEKTDPDANTGANTGANAGADTGANAGADTDANAGANAGSDTGTGNASSSSSNKNASTTYYMGTLLNNYTSEFTNTGTITTTGGSITNNKK